MPTLVENYKRLVELRRHHKELVAKQRKYNATSRSENTTIVELREVVLSLNNEVTKLTAEKEVRDIKMRQEQGVKVESRAQKQDLVALRIQEAKRKLEVANQNLAQAIKQSDTTRVETQEIIAREIERSTEVMEALEREIKERTAELSVPIDSFNRTARTQAEKDDLVKYQALEADERKAIDRAYLENRERLFDILNPILGEISTLKNLFVKSDDTPRNKVSVRAALGFGLSHPITALRATSFSGFAAEEWSRLLGILSGEVAEDKRDPSFFMRLLRDQEFARLLKTHSTNLGRLLDDVIPSSVHTILSMVASDTLRASLNKAGVTDRYIESKVLPVVTKPIKDLLQHYGDCAEVIDKVLLVAESRHSRTRQVALKAAINALPLARLLSDSNLGAFLSNEGAIVSRALSVAIVEIPDLRNLANAYQLTPTLLADVTLASSKLLGALLSDASSIEEIVIAVESLITDDTPNKIRKANTAEELRALDKELDDKIFGAFVSLSNVITSAEVFPVIAQNISTLLTEHSDIIVNLISSRLPGIIESTVDKSSELINESNSSITRTEIWQFEPLTALKLLQNARPESLKIILSAVIGSAGIILSSTSQEQASEIINGITDLMKPSPPIDTESTRVAGKIIANVMAVVSTEKVVQALSNNLAGALRTPEFVEVLSQVADNVIGSIPDISDDINRLRLTRDLVTSAAPVVVDISSTLLTHTKELLEGRAQFNTFQKAETPEEMQKALVGVLVATETVLRDLVPLLEGKVQEFVEKNKTSLRELPSIVRDGASLVPSTIPLIAQVAQTVLSKPDEIGAAYKHWVQYQIGNEKRLEPLLSSVTAMISDVTPIIETAVPRYLADNKKDINSLVKHITALPDTQKQIEAFGITPLLVQKAIFVGSDFIADVFPVLTKIANEALKDQIGVAKLMYSASAVMNINTLDDSVKEDVKKSTDTKEEKTLELAREVLSFAKNNPSILFSASKVPELLTKHAEALGGVMDEFLNRTDIGQKYNIKGRELLELASKKSDKIAPLLESYINKEYGRMILRGVVLLLDTEVLLFALKAIFTQKKQDTSMHLDNKVKNISSTHENAIDIGKGLTRHITSPEKTGIDNVIIHRQARSTGGRHSSSERPNSVR